MHRRLVGAVLVLAASPALAPAATSQAAPVDCYTIPGQRAFPEAIAVVPGSNTFFVSSVAGGTIFRGDLRRPALQPFLAGGANDRDVATGLAADRNGRLFVAGGSTGALFVYNTRSERLIRVFDTGLRAPQSFVNDVALAANGDAYATDSFRPVLYRVAAAAVARPSLSTSPPETLDLAGTPVAYGAGFNLNGIVATRGGGALVTVQSNTGALFRIDVASRTVAEVPVDSGRRLLNGDGMLLRGRTLYVVKNRERRVVVVQLSADLTSGRVIATIRDRSFAYPTDVAAGRGGRLLVVNSQLDRRAVAGQPRPTRRPQQPFTVSSVRRP